MSNKPSSSDDQDSLKAILLKQHEETIQYMTRLMKTTGDAQDVLRIMNDDKKNDNKMTLAFFLFGREEEGNEFIKRITGRYRILYPLLDKHGYVPKINNLVHAFRKLGRCYPDVSEHVIEEVLHTIETMLMKEENESKSWFSFLSMSKSKS